MGEPGSHLGLAGLHKYDMYKFEVLTNFPSLADEELAQALEKRKTICTAKRFSIIYHIAVWGIGKWASLLAEKVPCTEAV